MVLRIRERHRLRLGIVIPVQTSHVLALAILAWIDTVIKMNVNVGRHASHGALRSHVSPDNGACLNARCVEKRIVQAGGTPSSRTLIRTMGSPHNVAASTSCVRQHAQGMAGFCYANARLIAVPHYCMNIGLL